MSDHPVLQQASELRATLEALASALATGDALTVLDCEPRLAAAVAGWRTPEGVLDPAARTQVDDDVRRARRALDRCRATGTAAADLASATLAALGSGTPYSRQGEAAEGGAIRGRGVEARG